MKKTYGSFRRDDYPAGFRLPFTGKILCMALILFSMGTMQSLAQQQQRISLKKTNVPLAEVLKEIESKSDYLFNFPDELIKGKSSTVDISNATLDRVMEQILSNTGLTWEVSDNRYVTISQAPVRTEQQRRVTISGRVLDPDGQPLGGVAIVEQGSGLGVVTDTNGEYTITTSRGKKLRFTFLGYSDEERTVSGGTRIDITMQESESEIDQVVVVGYRSVKKVSLLGSVGVVEMAGKKQNEVITHVSQALYASPGVYINQNGAQPGRESATIRIRGVNTLSSASPLVLLDGIEYDIAEIDPADIESISVLKDVSAAIYGSKASNGVILVTSKKGSRGAPRIEYRMKLGVQQATYLPKMVTDPIQYMELRNQAEINSGISPAAVTYTQAQIDEYRAGMAYDPTVYPSSDWFDICFQNGFIQQHNLRLSGGNNAITYTLGTGYTYQKGVFIANDQTKRYSLDLKLTAHVNDRLNVSGSVQGNLRQSNDVGSGPTSTMTAIARGLPIFSDYHNNGVYGSTWLFTPGRNNIENPRMYVETGRIFRDYQEFLASVNVDYKFYDDLRYDATFSLRKIDHFSKNWTPERYTVNPKTGETKVFNTNAPAVQDWDAYHLQYGISHRITWERTLARKHDVHAMIGHDFQDMKRRNFTAKNYGFNDNTLQELDAMADDVNSTTTGSSSLDRLVSAYGRLAYTYDERYSLEATFRYDGSNRLAKGHQWAFFPSMLLGWRIDKESFFNVPDIDMLKLRASVGKMGSQAVSLYSTKMTVGSISPNYSFGGNVSGSWATTKLVDETLTWEKTTSYNIGIDIAALKGRLMFEGDIFYKRTEDILRETIIPSQIGGLSGPVSNIGTVDNKGYEISMSWRETRRGVNYGAYASVSFARNKVMRLNGEEQISGRFIIREGESINSYYLYKADGYYQSQEEIDNATTVYGSRDRLKPGYIKYVDVMEDGQIDEKDKVVCGNSLPEHMYSFGFNVGFKNFRLDAQFQGVGKVYVYLTGNAAVPFNNGAGVTTDWVTKSWTEDNRNSKYPLLTTYTNAGENFIYSDHWLQNASYLRLKNIQLSYTIPQELTRKIRIENLTVYASAQNLLTFSGLKIWDPEITPTRGSLYEYPNLKSITFGLNLTF